MASQARPGSKTIALELEPRPADWEIAPGRVVQGYGFNGQVPGPTIEGNVGDTLVIHLKNGLPEPTSIHWHGLRVPANMDGTEMMQNPVKPGETFEYRFLLPDAATFWYHPHVHETQQLEKGLYGAIIVRGPGEPLLDGEQLLVLDDIKLDRKGQLAPFGGWGERHEGRRGKTYLVNGIAQPELTMRAGQVERWRILNASSSRYALLSIGGRPFTLLGTDGGFLTAPVTVNQVLLAPADRVDIAVGPFAEGDTIPVESLPYNRGMMKERGGIYATLQVGPPAPSQAVVPSTLRAIEPLVHGEAAPNRRVLLSGRMTLHGVEWQINREVHHVDEPVLVGELQVWDILNRSGMDHPFHLHGFFFQVLLVNGQPPPFLSWEDTVNIPAKGQVRIAWLPDDRPGQWMYHCHILEHHAAGMMAHFEVISPTQGPSPAQHHGHQSHHGS